MAEQQTAAIPQSKLGAIIKTPDDKTSIQARIDELSQVNGNLHAIVNKLDAAIHRFDGNGSTPTDDKDKVEPVSHLDKLDQQIQFAHSLIGRLDKISFRLESHI